jgi:hypothetical protein
MKLGGVNTFAQGMKLEKRRWSLGVTGHVRSVTQCAGSMARANGRWPSGTTGHAYATVARPTRARAERTRHCGIDRTRGSDASGRDLVALCLEEIIPRMLGASGCLDRTRPVASERLRELSGRRPDSWCGCVQSWTDASDQVLTARAWKPLGANGHIQTVITRGDVGGTGRIRSLQ